MFNIDAKFFKYFNLWLNLRIQGSWIWRAEFQWVADNKWIPIYNLFSFLLVGAFRDNDRWMDKSKNLKLPQPRHLWRSRGGFYLRAPFPSWMVGSILILFSKIRDVRRITVMMLMLLSSKCLWDNQVKCSREMESVLGIENHYNTETARDWKGQVKGKQRRT